MYKPRWHRFAELAVVWLTNEWLIKKMISQFLKTIFLCVIKMVWTSRINQEDGKATDNAPPFPGNDLDFVGGARTYK